MCFSSAPDAAPRRNYRDELNQTLRGDQDVAPGYFALNQQFQPLYTGLQLDNTRLSALGYDDESGAHHPGTLELGRTSTEFNRAGDVQDVATYGPAATAAYLNANPWLGQGLANLSGRMVDSPLLSTLNTQANDELAQGGQLSPEQLRNVNQGTRSLFAANGMAHGNQALGAELLNREGAQQQRLAAARGFATQVQGLNQAQNDFVGRGTQIAGTVLADPFQAILGRSSGAGGGGQGGGYPQTVGTGSTLFNPQNPYANDVFSSNFNATAANNIQQANASNANTSGWLTLAGALLSDERLKTDIKRTGERTIDDIPIVTGRYRHDPKKRRFKMVLAKDVEKRRPDAVVTDPVSGLRAVKYGMIAAPFQELLGKAESRKLKAA
jgi:hypothetical protein